MPRMEAESTEEDPEKGEPASRFTFGASRDNAVISVIPFCLSMLDEKAEIAMGTSWTFWLRFVAVTTTSCRSTRLSALTDAS